MSSPLGPLLCQFRINYDAYDAPQRRSAYPAAALFLRCDALAMRAQSRAGADSSLQTSSLKAERSCAASSSGSQLVICGKTVFQKATSFGVHGISFAMRAFSRTLLSSVRTLASEGALDFGGAGLIRSA